MIRILCVCVLVPVSGCARHSAPEASKEPPLTRVSGDDVRRLIESFRGKQPVLVNVWATWCAPCVKEFPALVELRRRYETRAAVLLISADFLDQDTAVRKFLHSRGVTWETYIKSDADQAFISAWDSDWTGALPATFIYDMEGKRVAFWESAAQPEEFEGEIQKVVGDSH